MKPYRVQVPWTPCDSDVESDIMGWADHIAILNAISQGSLS